VILLQPKLTKLKLENLKSDFYRKKKDMNMDKLTINWQNFAQVRLQLKFAFMIWPKVRANYAIYIYVNLTVKYLLIEFFL